MTRLTFVKGDKYNTQKWLALPAPFHVQTIALQVCVSCVQVFTLGVFVHAPAFTQHLHVITPLYDAALTSFRPHHPHTLLCRSRLPPWPRTPGARLEVLPLSFLPLFRLRPEADFAHRQPHSEAPQGRARYPPHRHPQPLLVPSEDAPPLAPLAPLAHLLRPRRRDRRGPITLSRRGPRFLPRPRRTALAAAYSR